MRFVFRSVGNRLLPLLLLAVILVFAVFAVRDAANSSARLQYDMTLHSINRALSDCFAIEGYYPPNMEYLYEHYRVRVDEEKYLVIYDIFAPNVRPTVRLIDRKLPIYG